MQNSEINRRKFLKYKGLFFAGAMVLAGGARMITRNKKTHVVEIKYLLSGITAEQFEQKLYQWERAELIQVINEEFSRRGLLLGLTKNVADKNGDAEIVWTYEFASKAAAKMWEKVIYGKFQVVWNGEMPGISLSSREYSKTQTV